MNNIWKGGGYEVLFISFGGHYKLGYFGGHFYTFYVFKIKVQNGNMFWGSQMFLGITKLQVFFFVLFFFWGGGGMPDIPILFFFFYSGGGGG